MRLHRKLQLAQQQQAAAATAATEVAAARAERRGAKGVEGVESGPLRVAAPRREDSAAADRGDRGRMLQPRGGRLDGAVRAPPLELGLGLGLGVG